MKRGAYMTKESILNAHKVKKNIMDLLPGDMILHPLYRSDGLLLIDKNKILDESVINIIRKHVLPSYKILVSPTEEKRNEALKEEGFNNEIFIEDLSSNVNKFKPELQFDSNTIQNQIENSENSFVRQLVTCPLWSLLESGIESEQLRNRCIAVKSDFVNLLNGNKMFDYYYKIMKSYGDVLLISSINTTCSALMMGLTLEMKNEDVIDLAISGLFLNIGFTVLPKKKYKTFLLTQEFSNEAIVKSIEIFSNITTDNPELRKKTIIQGILDHQELYNGLGYPSQKKGEEISLFGRILHIAYSYDSLVGGYDDSVGIFPMEALQLIYDNKENRYDTNIMSVFLHRTNYFKVGETMFLPNGDQAKIIGFDNYIKHPERPIVEYADGRKFNFLTMTEYSN